MIFTLLGLKNVPKINVRLLSSLWLCWFKPNFNSIKYASNMAYRNNNILKGFMDRYNGITIASDMENCDIKDFPFKLEESLKYWETQKLRGIWFKVFLDHTAWVPVLAKSGFKFHHAKENYVMLCKWLPTNEPNAIPPYPHTTLGVGAVVINDNNQILVVQERHSIIPSFWKLPGGYVEPGENLVDAAIREVIEETGIKTEFETLLTIRHVHGGNFGCSDLYTVIALKPLTSDIEKATHELAACKWMKVDEYLKESHVHGLNKMFVESYLRYKEQNLSINCEHGVHPIVKRAYTVYYVVSNNNKL